MATDESIPKNELGFWDKKVYEETYEDLENLSNLLTDVGVKVYNFQHQLILPKQYQMVIGKQLNIILFIQEIL